MFAPDREGPPFQMKIDEIPSKTIEAEAKACAEFVESLIAGLEQILAALPEDERAKHRERFARSIEAIMDWIVGDAWAQLMGIGARAYVFAWFVSPRLRKLTQGQLAALIGLKYKQSIGRNVSKFRDRFGVQTHSMQSEAGRKSCRERERKKREAKLAA